MTMVPATHCDLRRELLSIFEATLDTSRFVGGDVVQAFEEELLPMGPELLPEQQQTMANAVRRHLG